MANEYVSLKNIGDRLLRTNVMKGLSWDFIIDSTIDFMDIVGIPASYINKLYTYKIEDYRVPLPCDFVEETMVLFSNKNSSKPATYATDTFHEHYDELGAGNNTYTYSINNSYIFTSIKDGELLMNYKAIQTDSEGYPMLPSNRVFQSALEWYIKVGYFTILWEDGKLEDKRLENAKQEYAWAVGRLETDSARLSLGKAEAFFNSFRTLVPRDNEFTKRFANTGAKEYIKVQ